MDDQLKQHIRGLQTKSGVVSRSMSMEYDVDCTDAAAPLAILLGWLNLEVAAFLVKCDDPFLFETVLGDIVIPKGRGSDINFFHIVRVEDIACENHPLLNVWDMVDSKPSCEFHFESIEGS